MITSPLTATAYQPPPPFLVTEDPTQEVPILFTYTLGASGTTPITFTVDSTALPAGLTFDGVNTISGYATQAGVYPVTLTATNAQGQDTETLTLTVQAIRTIPTARVGRMNF